jgi:hypothetical protein
VLAETTFHSFELREVVPALGQSRCNDALTLLLDLGTKNTMSLQGAVVEWINAIVSLGTEEAKQVLLSFADPDIPDPGILHRFEHHEFEELASQIAEIACTDPSVKIRLYSLCGCVLDHFRRPLLARVLALFQTQDALLAGLHLIGDEANPSIPLELVRG